MCVCVLAEPERAGGCLLRGTCGRRAKRVVKHRVRSGVGCSEDGLDRERYINVESRKKAFSFYIYIYDRERERFLTCMAEVPPASTREARLNGLNCNDS